MGVSKKKLLLSAFETYLRESEDSIFFKNKDLVYVAASLPFARLVGCSDIKDVVGKTDFELFEDKELARRYVEDDKRMISQGESLRSFIEPIPALEGRQRFSRTHKSLIRDDKGGVIGVYGMGRDVTREYEARLNYERERRYLLELPDDAYWAALIDVTDWKQLDMRFSSKWGGEGAVYEDIEGFASASAASVTAGDVARSFYEDFTREHIEGIFNDGIRNMEYEYLRHMPDGREAWVREDVHILVNPANRHVEALLSLHDIDEVMREKDQLLHLAEHDAMTGLLNHEATLEHIRSFLGGEGIRGTHTLFMIDIDDFKAINDTFGHRRGDDVIIGIATAIRSAFRDSDVIGRVGGDEFLALMKNVERRSAVEQKARNLVELLSRISEGELRLSGSVGAATYMGDGESLDKLFSEADAALYRAKQNGKNSYVIYDSGE